jgi:hypothetical protein
MACLHGKTSSYNLLEGIYANAVAQEVERFCVESCNGCQTGHPSQRQHDCLVMNENERWQMYGLQAIERVNGKRMVWNEFAEAKRVLKLAVDRDVLEHLQQLEKDPDSYPVLLNINSAQSYPVLLITLYLYINSILKIIRKSCVINLLRYLFI